MPPAIANELASLSRRAEVLRDHDTLAHLKRLETKSVYLIHWSFKVPSGAQAGAQPQLIVIDQDSIWISKKALEDASDPQIKIDLLTGGRAMAGAADQEALIRNYLFNR